MTYVHVRELEAYKVSYAFVLKVHKLTGTFPKEEFYGGLVDQMRRASRSVCANIVEGLGKNSTPNEEKRFLNMAQGSVEEMRFWLKLRLDLTYTSAKAFEILDAGYDRAGRLIVGLMKKRMVKHG